MKNPITLALVCIVLLCNNAMAQQETTTAAISTKENNFSLPPLMDLIDSAIKKNASVQYRRLEIKVKEANVKTEKTFWTRNLGFQADSRYGTFDNFSSSTVSQSTTLLSSTSRQLNYGVGVFLKMPLADLINRKNQVKRSENELEEAKQLAEVQADAIRQDVIKLYQDVLLRQKLLLLKSSALGTARANAEMAEKEFHNGVIPLTEYVRITDIVSHTEYDYESEKKEFITAKLLLENLTGVTISTNPAKK